MIQAPAQGAAGCEGTAARDELLSLEALLLSRAYLYTLFHKVFGGEPDERLLAALGCEAVSDVIEEFAYGSETLTNLKGFVARVGRNASDASYLEEVREEFACFFQGPAQPPAFPWESPYLGPKEAMVFQPSTLLVRDAYRERGLRVKKYQRMPDDHVAIMCAFMAALSAETLDSFRAGNAERVRLGLDAQLAFLRDHMVNWLPEYAELSLRVRKAVMYPQFIQGVSAFAKADQVSAAQAIVWLSGLEDGLPVADARKNGDSPFASAELALEELRSLDLRGIDDNELERIA